MANIHEIVSDLSLKHFNSLPKTGKPTEKEWTILSCIVQEFNKKYEVVALGTGSKCIGQNKLSPKGDILNDSHAEVICRRAFLRYIYHSMLDSNNHIINFDKIKKIFIINDNVKFHFFTTHVPCGDAAIFLKPQSEDVGSICVCENEELDPPNKKIKLDIFRTGAKCLENDEQQDPKLDGTDYHITGVVRTKPGRGVRTLSVSCSDKIARWCHVGMQGALLSLLLDKPIYFDTFTIVGNTQFNLEALERALFKRLGDVSLESPYQRKDLKISQVDHSFKYYKSTDKNPSPNSIAWFKKLNSRTEVAVEGRKLGVTKKNLDKPSSRLSICKLELFNTFSEIIKSLNINISNNANLNYHQTKILAANYNKNWTILKKKFGVWTVKNNNLLLFHPK